jgi:hypothetical protein
LANEDKALVEAAIYFPEVHEFKHGDLVRQKPGLMYVTIGDTCEPYKGNFGFVQWISTMVGTNDDPMHYTNLMNADCIVMAHNGRGGFCPILMDSRFLELAVESMARGDLSRDKDGLPG